MTVPRRFGSTSRKMTPMEDAPDARAASTKSRVRIVIVWPRTMRAVYGQPKTLSTRTSSAGRLPAGRADRIAIMKMSAGKAMRKSMIRETTWSTIPPK